MRLGAASVVVCVAGALTARAGILVDLGEADIFTLSQPVVQTQVGSFDSLLDEYLLDTGASGILVGGAASVELASLGLETVATYTDFGVAGPQSTRVSQPYDFHYAGSDGVPLSLPGVRLQTSSGNFSFYSGIAGMPLMMHRSVGLDLAAQADPGALRIGVSFGSGPPPAVGRQYSVPLSMVTFPLSGQQHPDDPLPASAPLPFLPVQVTSGTRRFEGEFLLDTGAQQCILSSDAAIALGLDANGNGSLDDEAESFQTVAGVGGAVQIPVLSVDAVALRAVGGVDLSFGRVAVGIVDIDPSISGVLGMNVLNTGWEIHALQSFLGIDPGPPGVFNRVDLDFRDAAATMRGELRLTVNETRLSASGWAVPAGSVVALGPDIPETVARLVNEGLLDVGTGKLTVQSGLTGSAIIDAITAVIGGSATGITSSAAATTPYRTVGWREDGDGAITFGFAAAGDLNLDGVVDFDDIRMLVTSGKFDTGLRATWSEGDYDHNGVVDFDDVAALVAAGLYDAGDYRPTVGSSGLAAASLAGWSGEFGVAAVPEPPASLLVAVGAAVLAAAGCVRMAPLKKFLSRMVVAACFAAITGEADAQIRVVQYNVNNSDPAQTGPRTGMNTVLSAINASAKGGFARPIDLLVLEEAESVTTTGAAYANLLNTITGGTSYARSTVDGSTTGSGRPIAVYNSASLQLIGEAKIGSTSGTAGQPRQTMRYQFRPVGYDSSADFYVYASHFKASTGGANEAERNVEATAIRANADALGAGARIIYAGDYNLYSSSEAAFQTLTGTGNGQAFDPVNRVGSWSNTASFKDVHTQSPATTAAFNGQVTGGMDDRFDFQLVSGEVLDGRGFDYVSSSYWAFGNTATHSINGAITSGSAASLAAAIPGYTTSQASAVLTALSQVTDHIPVVADYQLPARMSAAFAGLPAQVIRGASVTGTLSVSNAAPVSVAAGADRLDYSYTSSGLFTGSGTGSDMALGTANNHLLTVNTATTGLRSGTVGVTASSPQAMSPTFTGTYSLGVLDHAIGSFASATTTTALDIDFGTLTQNASAAIRSFDIFNRSGALGGVWTAKLDLDAITPSGPAGIFSTTLAPFTNLASGSSRSFTATMAATTTGSFTSTLTLTASDENLPGAASQSLLLTLRGIVKQADTIRTVAGGQVVQDTAALAGEGQLIKQGTGELVRGGSSSYTGGTVVQQGLLTVTSSSALGSGPLTVADGAGVSLQAATLAVTSLDLAAAGKLDLGAGRVAVAAGGITEAALRAAIVAGRGDGSWNGATGVTSGNASAAGAGRAVGYVIDPLGAVTAGFAAPGDLNLDGMVDFDDVSTFVGFGLYDTGRAATWATGDFDYNGIVDFDDVLALVSAGLYDTGSYLPAAVRGSAFRVSDPMGLTGLSAQGDASFAIAVPEPEAACLAAQAVGTALALVPLLRRRRSREAPIAATPSPASTNVEGSGTAVTGETGTTAL